MRERDLLATAGAHLDGAWADWSALELRLALDGIDDRTIKRLDRGRIVSLTPPRDLDDVFDRTLLVEQAAEQVAEAELPQSQARGWQSVPGLFDEPLLTPEDERRLGLRVRRGDRGAMNRLVSSNTRLCITHIRKPAARPGLDEEDQLQEAFLGLIRAAGKFEIDRGFKFSTYATRWIRQTISRAIADKALTIRLPVHVLDRMNKVRTARQELRRELRREPTDDEIRAATDVDPSDLVYPTRISRPLEPLDARADAIPDYETPEAIALENSAREEAASWLSRLDDRTADVLRRRYGIGQEEQTLQEVGDALRFTRERARQIESAGLKQLQELASSDVRRPPTRVPSARPPRPVHQPRRPNQFRFPDITRRSPARSDRDAPVDSGLRASNGIDWIPASARIEQVLRVHRRPKDSGPAEVTVQVLWTTKHTGYVRWTEGAAHVSVGNLVGMDAMAVAKFQRPVAEPGEALPDETAA